MKIVISGYGKMGRMVDRVLSERGIGCAGRSENIQEFDKALARECVCIDFTVPDAFRANYRFLAENFKAVVVGTTGWGDIKDEVCGYFEKCGTPMIYASNFSVGVNVLFAAADYLSSMLGKAGGYSPYILEMHHCWRPSWTGIWVSRPMYRLSVAGRYPGYILSDSRERLTGSHSVTRLFQERASHPEPSTPRL